MEPMGSFKAGASYRSAQISLSLARNPEPLQSTSSAQNPEPDTPLFGLPAWSVRDAKTVKS